MEKIPFQNLAFVAGVAGTILVVLVAVLVRRAMDKARGVMVLNPFLSSDERVVNSSGPMWNQWGQARYIMTQKGDSPATWYTVWLKKRYARPGLDLEYPQTELEELKAHFLRLEPEAAADSIFGPLPNGYYKVVTSSGKMFRIHPQRGILKTA
jgi:hypothetical protein